MSIHIVTDSTCDLPPEILLNYPITVIPCYININDKSYLDGIEISREEFYQYLPDAIHPPTTSAPGPGMFHDAYTTLAKQGATTIFSIHITKHFSNICNVAGLAAEEIKTVPIHVIDSGNLTLAEGMVVLRAAQAARNGANAEQVMEVIQSTIKNAYAYAKLDTVDYLKRSGRLSTIQHGVISLLDIKPILKMNDGLAKMEVVRTKGKAFLRVLEKAKEIAPKALLFGITHAQMPDQVEAILSMLKDQFPSLPHPLVSEVTPALGTHLGPGALCLSWIAQD